MSLDTIWQPPCANIAYRKPYFLYNQPNSKPKPPFNKKHLAIIIGEFPNIIKVVGKCPAANNSAVKIFANTKTPVDGFFPFCPKILCKIQATKDIANNRSMTSSTTAPYVTLANM